MSHDEPTGAKARHAREVAAPSRKGAPPQLEAVAPAAAYGAIAALSVALSKAESLDDGAAAALAAIERCFAPRGAQIVWGVGGGQRLFDRGVGELRAPDAATLDGLRDGQCVVRGAAEQPGGVYAPLANRSLLSGWVFLDDPGAWDSASPALLGALAGQAAATLAMIEGEQHQAERTGHLRTLALVGQHISGVLDLDELLTGIHTATRRVIDADDFFIALYEPATASLEASYVVASGERRYVHDRWPTHVGLSGLILRNRAPILTDDYTAECQRRGILTYAIGGLPAGKAWMGVPLIVRDRTIGVMTVSSHRAGYRYRSEHVDLLMTIASQAAVAIENARLYRRSERQARQLETLNRIGRAITSWLDFEQVPSVIMDQVARLLDVEEGSLLLTDENTGDLFFAYTASAIGSRLLGQRLPRGTGLAGYVVSSGQSVIANDVQRDSRFNPTTDQATGYITRRLLAVPLRGVGGVQGVIEVLNRRDNSPFTDEDCQLLEALADYAVIAIENARRFTRIDQALARRAQDLARINDQLQHNLRSLTALNAIGMAINSSLRSPDEIYRMTTSGVVEMTSALGAWVVLRSGDGWRAAITIGPALSDLDPLLGVVRRVVASGRPELLTEDLPTPAARVGAKALLVVPLRAPRDVRGCLCVTYEERPPEAPDRETVALFATQAASAVESLELFSAVSSARDEMASILASTREGIMLIGPDGRIAVANASLRELCALPADVSTTGMDLPSFLATWGAQRDYSAEEWAALAAGLEAVLARADTFRGGELSDQRAGQALEWAVLAAFSSGESQGGVLLVLRDITAAKESEQLRQDLTHMIVHDLRSPLSSVMASIDLLVRGVAGDMNDNQQHVLNIASESAQQMLAMINTLLDISRLEAGRMPLTLAPADVPAIAQRTIAQLTSLAQERSIVIELQHAPSTPPAVADGALVARIIQNLVANAIKFSGRNATVTVSIGTVVAADPSGAPEVVVSVRDQGVGIAPKDREKIFAKFGQVGERRGGTGLGLTFCKLAAEAHGGRIWVESQLGEGSTFSFALPAQPALPPAAEP